MSVSDSTAYIIDEPSPDLGSSQDELDSLPDSADSDSIDSDLEESDAEREWKESLEQLELLLTMVIVPYLGKYFGRKCAYWGEFSVEKKIASSKVAKIVRASTNRLGKVHGVEVSGGSRYYKQKGLQGCWDC